MNVSRSSVAIMPAIFFEMLRIRENGPAASSVRGEQLGEALPNVPLRQPQIYGPGAQIEELGRSLRRFAARHDLNGRLAGKERLFLRSPVLP